MTEGTTNSFFLDFISGGVSAGISKTVVAPLSRVSLLLQTQDINPQIPPHERYKGFGDAFFRIPQEQGIPAYWRGNLSNVIRYFPTQALNFAFNDKYKKIFMHHNPRTDYWKFFLENLVCGTAVGATTLLFVYPLDVAKYKLMADVGRTLAERQFTGIIDCLSKIYELNGLEGLYRGFGVSVLGLFAYRAAYFGFYDLLYRVLYHTGKDNFIYKFLMAQFVAISSNLVTYPLATVARRLMMQSGRKDMLYNGVLDCFRKIYKNEGISGFFKGALVSIIATLGISAVLTLYDGLKEKFSKSKK